MNDDNYWKKYGEAGQEQVFLSYGDKKGYLITRVTNDRAIMGTTWVETEDQAEAAYSGWVRYFQRKNGNPEGILPK